jgi:hypothetical protein
MYNITDSRHPKDNLSFRLINPSTILTKSSHTNKVHRKKLLSNRILVPKMNDAKIIISSLQYV